MAAALISCGAFVPLAVTGKWPLHTRCVSRITDRAPVTSNIVKSVCLVGNGRLKDRCGLDPRTDFRLRNRQKIVRIRLGADWIWVRIRLGSGLDWGAVWIGVLIGLGCGLDWGAD